MVSNIDRTAATFSSPCGRWLASMRVTAGIVRPPGQGPAPAIRKLPAMGERRGLRIGGIPIHVEWPFFLIAAILGGNRIRTWSGNRFVFLLIWVAIVFVSVLVHELGHAMA